ncbi:replication restart helicase PriA [Spirochaeta isovalerica]|uniref:Replication restart protein PriA n=1 Tax=Spirochaeta isovalerica TaxID=150 RepID=A0A841RBR2_9SPIO|nr:primosomal protein N' [Spirochaeta isovalerica]MBB6480801.1 primosomal protein N' (replication factor Y) [Spirochaeta isovalerica]
MEDKIVEVAFNTPVNQSFSYKWTGDGEVKIGCRITAPFGRRKLTGWVIGLPEAAPSGFELKEIEKVVDGEPLFDEDLLELARWLASLSLCSLGEALAVMLPGGRQERDIPALGLDDPVDASGDMRLSEEQTVALEEIRKEKGGFYYLYGITGSGKTEVFLQAAREAIDRGESVIYLVPEISLTHQLVDVIRGRFDCGSAVLHSHLTPSQKLKEWRRIQSGEALLVIGARSAVFAPVKNPGLIIIDEEHENSYKSGSTPRYHGRQVAMKRCRTSGASLIMGSATPSVEAWHLMEKKVIKKLTLTKRLAGGGLPEITVIDMKDKKGVLSPELIGAIRETHNRGKQTILFLNRRGFSYFFHCRSCGYEMKCRNCSVSLTYHKNSDFMVCHYCGYKVRPVHTCPECSSLDVGYSGFGTEQIEEEVQRLFPDLTVSRLDTDSASKKGVMQETLKAFRKGESHILLGTQMVAKGLNFPDVSLVGIVLADTGLNLPDFRASERTFSLITQVAGRAGRFSDDGKVYIQTFKPGTDAVRNAAEGNIDEFYSRELELRHMLDFPPFCRLFRIVFRGKNPGEVKEAAFSFSRELMKVNSGTFELLGPSECPLSIISGNHRFQILLRSGDFSGTHARLEKVYRNSRFPSRIYCEIDIDPLSLL